MRILGVDPGLMITGYGILDTDDDNITVVEAGVIRTNAKLPLEGRLKELATEMSAIMTQFMPDVVAVEELYSHYGHPKTAIIMGHARGVIFLKAGEGGKMVYTYAATRIKKSLTGNGRATKKQVQLMIKSGFDPARAQGMTRDVASRLIDELRKNKWEPPAGWGDCLR